MTAPGSVPDGGTVEARLARWTARDAEIGAAAERDQLRIRLAERDREVADLAERVRQLNNRVGQLSAERDRLLHAAADRSRPGIGNRAYRRLRSFVGRQLRR